MNVAAKNTLNRQINKQYLSSSLIINWHHPSIRELAAHLSNRCTSWNEITKNCFKWVRDNIKHSYDYKLNPVTCIASDVLQYRTGYCYAKSHLLAALLRANRIPSGLCYQRLRLENNKDTYCLHGLNAVSLPDIGWYRMDARGNKSGIDAQFCPPVEKLAFDLEHPCEYNIPEIYAEPLDVVIDTLTKCTTYGEVYNNLPDVK